MKIAFDLSSYMWTALLAGKDTENGKEVLFNDKKVFVNSSEHGYENVMNMFVAALRHNNLTPMHAILVPEGLSSKGKRLMIDQTYKASRDSHPPEAYQAFHELRERLLTLWQSLGATAMTQDYAEGDDTLAWLAANTKEDLIIATADNDLAALNGVNSHGAKIETYIDGMSGVNKFGMFPHYLITTYKALVGDTTDNIKGVPGLGPATFHKFCDKYGIDGLQELHEMLLSQNLGPLHQMAENKEHSIVKLIVDNEAQAIRSFELARLRPEWVNTAQCPLKIVAGKVAPLYPTADERVQGWFGRGRLVTASTFATACEWARKLIANSEFVSLDIETSTSDASTEWLEARGKPNAVDVFGSTLTGMSLTFGDNQQYSLYFSVDHAETDNIKSEDLRDFIASLDCDFVIQNTAFELVVLFNEWGEAWKDNGFHGFLPNILDTKLEASYVDENIKLGLKERSKLHLGYQQVDYETTTSLEGPPTSLRPGGMLKRVVEEDDDGIPTIVVKQYKMRELPATHVLSYGLDDTICTSALHNYYKLVMQLEGTWEVYKQVELAACYANASAFIHGIPFSMERMMQIAKDDEATVDREWPVLRKFLIDNGWSGTVPPVYTSDISAKEIKEAYSIVTGKADTEGEDSQCEADEFLSSRVRTPQKLVALAEHLGHGQFAAALAACIAGDAEVFTRYVQAHFTGEPVFNIDSPTQMQKLMYEVLKLPIRLTNKATDAQRARGQKTGSPKTDDLAIETALHYDGNNTNIAVLKAIQEIKTCGTRSKLFYEPYKSMPHWIDNKLHPSTNQCATVTRRNSASDPNYTQWPAKGEGIKFRECIVASGPDRVIISADCSGQELRLAADFSRDANMLSCYIGDNKRDIHSMVAASACKYLIGTEMSYDEFYSALKGEDEELAEKMDMLRSKSKAVNFGELYGSMAQSLSKRLMISEEEAEKFLSAKKAAFPEVEVWKESVVANARKVGYSLTKLGARRHMGSVLMHGDKWEISRAERQLSNFCIQSSGAEAVKIALGKCFFSELMRKATVKIIGSIHDEIVLDCPRAMASDVANELKEFMSAPYGGMIVPFESEVVVGFDFGKMAKLSSSFTQEEVEEKLKKLASS